MALNVGLQLEAHSANMKMILTPTALIPAQLAQLAASSLNDIAK